MMGGAASLHHDRATFLLFEERDQLAPAQLRPSSTFPVSFTPWIWKTDLAVSRPIMLMLIAGGSFVAGSDNPHFGTLMPLGPSTPSENRLRLQYCADVAPAAAGRGLRRRRHPDQG